MCPRAAGVLPAPGSKTARWGQKRRGGRGFLQAGVPARGNMNAPLPERRKAHPARRRPRRGVNVFGEMKTDGPRRCLNVRRVAIVALYVLRRHLAYRFGALWLPVGILLLMPGGGALLLADRAIGKLAAWLLCERYWSNAESFFTEDAPEQRQARAALRRAGDDPTPPWMSRVPPR